MSKFSDNLVYLRKREGLSQQELADKMNVSRSLVGMYEAGQRMPSFEMLEALADIFNVNIDFLIGHETGGTDSQKFRENLANIIENTDRSDLIAAGIDPYETGLIIDGALPLSFDTACQLAESLGETLDSMMGKNERTPTLEDESGLAEMSEIFTELSSENRSKLLELSRLFLDAQRKIEQN